MSLGKIICCGLYLVFCFEVVARDFAPLQNQLSLIEKQLMSRMKHSSDHFSEVKNISFNFAWNQGVQYQINLKQPLNLWLTNQKQQKQNKQTVNYVEKHNYPREQQRFNKIKREAKELSHQAYSLERKINSMEKYKESLTPEEKIALAQRIENTRKELAELTLKKQNIKPRYEQAKHGLSSSKKQGDIKPTIFFNPFEKNISALICESDKLASLLLETESISFIVKASGDYSHGRYKDTIYNFDQKTIAACNKHEIDAAGLLELAGKHSF